MKSLDQMRKELMEKYGDVLKFENLTDDEIKYLYPKFIEEEK